MQRYETSMGENYSRLAGDSNVASTVKLDNENHNNSSDICAA
jgi:hypothetical protein